MEHYKTNMHLQNIYTLEISRRFLIDSKQNILLSLRKVDLQT